MLESDTQSDHDIDEKEEDTKPNTKKIVYSGALNTYVIFNYLLSDMIK